MVKSVLKAIPVYWMHFWIPVGILERIRKICFKFLWSGNNEASGLPWSSWKVLANPKSLGGWGLKIPALFAKSLAAKSVWNLINGTGLWVQIAIQKYISRLTLLDWIRVDVKKKKGISICWKAALWSFDLIGQALVWRIGTGTEVRMGIDPWLGCKWRHFLPVSMIDKLHSVGSFVLKVLLVLVQRYFKIRAG